MNFISINQYFNKLLIVFLAFLLTPLLVFIVLYSLGHEYMEEPGVGYFIAIPAFALLDWILALAMFNKKIKTAQHAQGLGAKLEKYFDITIVRYCLLACSGLVLAAGFYLTGVELFTLLYLGSLIATVFFWPTGPRAARELLLKGDEREMVYYRKDSFGV